MKKPRKPKKSEQTELTRYLDHVFGGELGMKQAEWEVECAFIAVFDDFVTGIAMFPFKDEPYVGKLMTVVWDADPSCYEVFIWREGKMIHVDQDEGLRKEEGGIADDKFDGTSETQR